MCARHPADPLTYPSGGLGLAALQLASAIGAVRMGTASSSAKRRHMRSLGVHVTVSSRLTDFVEELATVAAQPEALLNSLTSPGDRFMAARARRILSYGQFSFC